MLGRIHSLPRRLGYRSYYRLVTLNYRYRLFARHNRTPAGVFRCYELLNRHGDDPMLAAMGRDCGPTDVVYDVGANVGVYALALASAADRRVVAFEPSPLAVEQLRANVARNGLHDRIDVRQLGLGAETGKARFYRSTYPELSAFDRESATRWGARVAETVDVPVTTLDDVAAGGPEPDVVKLDVEGAGPSVLSGAEVVLEKTRPTLYVEVHSEGLSGDRPAEIRSLLETAGYRIESGGGYWRCLPG